MLSKAAICLIALCGPIFASTYYVDFSTGADTNNGTGIFYNPTDPQ